MPPVYYDSVREYLIDPTQRSGVAYVREALPAIAVCRPNSAVAVDAKDALLLRLREFFEKEENLKRLRNYLKEHRRDGSAEKAPVSLRILDFLCSDNGIALEQENDISDAYQGMLRAYSKAYFDIFSRGARIQFTVGTSTFETTVGQLQFFRWAIERGLLDQVDQQKTQLRASARARARLAAKKEIQKSDRRLAAKISIGGPFHANLAAVKKL